MIEFKFNDKKSLTDFDIVAKSVKRPLLPALSKKQITIPGHQGTYDFGDNTYSNRTISVLLQFIGNDIADLRTQARNIAAWLSKKAYLPLTFDDEQDRYYMARVYEGIDLDVFIRAGEATVTFECMPFALYQVSTGEDITWDTDLPWDTDFTWENLLKYTVAVTGNTTFDIDYYGTEEVGLGSPSGSQFEIIISGSFTTLSITLNGKTIIYNEAVNSQTVVINNIDATVKTDNINKLSVCSGNMADFLRLIPGINTATITGTGLNCSVLFDFRPQYL